jgi:hypothetical protein
LILCDNTGWGDFSCRHFHHGLLGPANYDSLIGTIRSLVETARHSAARSVNALMTATYWEIGRRIVEFEQHGSKRAG